MFDNYILNPFLAVMDKYYSNNAFCINDIFYTYNDFAKCISKIRKSISTKTFKGNNIGIVANDDLETYASIFAVWMEGFAYVPLHPQQPINRNKDIITQAEVDLVIVSEQNNLYSDYQIIESSELIFDEYLLTKKEFSDDKIAYILFTSGSTGKPKGVSLSRENIGSFMKSFFEVGFEIGCEDRCLQCFDLTFDVSVQSFLVPLTKGACTYTIPHDQIKFSYVYGLLIDHQLTFGAMAPSMLRYLRPYFSEIYAPSMRYNILTAEASPIDLVVEWATCIPNAVIYDFYGPTEVTIYCTYYKYERGGNTKTLNGMLSIGKALNGLTAIILDEAGNILPKNQKGELCFAGPQLTPGYWKNPEKNQESFFEMEVNSLNQRFYKTGDSCYFDDDGDIMLAGRLDYQVKIQGYRIELGEIEYHARESIGGTNAIAISFENSSGNTEIGLCIEMVNEEKCSHILNYLRNKIPLYMLPTKIIAINPFPLNANGKVDRIALKKLI